MTINQMRAFILHEYPNAGMAFREKVTKMKPSQVIAIYKNIQKRKSDPLVKLLDRDGIGYTTPDGAYHICGKDEEKYHQMDIFEWMVLSNQGAGTHTEIYNV